MSARSRVGIVVLACAAVLLATTGSAAGATASRATFGYFKLPSGNLICGYSYGVKGLKPSVLCGVKSGLKPPPPRRNCHGEGDYAGDRVTMQSTGRVSVPRCAGDPGPFAGEKQARVLAYGKTWRHGGIRCRSAERGLTCRNKSKHGFFLSRDSWRRF